MGQNIPIRNRTAGFGLWFHLSGFHFGYAFLTHTQMGSLAGKQRPTIGSDLLIDVIGFPSYWSFPSWGVLWHVLLSLTLPTMQKENLGSVMPLRTGGGKCSHSLRGLEQHGSKRPDMDQEIRPVWHPENSRRRDFPGTGEK